LEYKQSTNSLVADVRASGVKTKHGVGMSPLGKARAMKGISRNGNAIEIRTQAEKHEMLVGQLAVV
jgi:hypothetical protein